MNEERHVTPPPAPFSPAETTLPAGTDLFRVHARRFGPADFNPGNYEGVRANRNGLLSPVYRYSYFYEDESAFLPVPALYAAGNENVALWETVLRDYSRPAGFIPTASVKHQALSRVTTARDVRLASLAGADMAAFRLPDDELRFPKADQYAETVPWGRAAWRAGYDGIVYVSQKDTSGLAYVFFDRGGAVSLFHASTPRDTLHDFNDLSRGGGFEWLSIRLQRWNVKLSG